MDPTVYGTAKVTVYNVPPSIGALGPWTLPVGPWVLRIDGTGFVAGALVLWNNQVLTPAVVTPTQVTLTGTTSASANVLIRVVNPGSIPSNPLRLGVGSGGGTPLPL
ncbi:MAG: hypothetical protein SGI92_00225 [Bryobacteraceae bacterium]|nr:hypothetical protein [Bryobacteraceae bacterium]